LLWVLSLFWKQKFWHVTWRINLWGFYFNH
jgi:hypothetical protein